MFHNDSTKSVKEAAHLVWQSSLSALHMAYFVIFYLILKQLSCPSGWKSVFRFQIFFREMFFLWWISACYNSESCSQAYLWPMGLLEGQTLRSVELPTL